MDALTKRAATAGSAPTEISRTSLTPPRVRARSVDRSRLLDVFDESVFCAVVRAPAGYGKSTLLTQWCDREDTGPVAWFSLDDFHDDPVSFWLGFTAAIDRVLPGFGASYVDLLQRPGVSVIDSVLPRVINEIVDLPEHVSVVLDDLQTVTNQVTLNSLTSMMSQFPKNLRLLIGTRAEPSLPLTRLRASGQLVEIDVTQLAFDRHDAELMLRAMCADLSDSDIKVAIAKAEGWPSGLAMMGMVLAGEVERASFLADFDGRDVTIENYLLEEVLNQLSHEDRRWMQLTSVLDVLAPDSCDAVAEVTDSGLRLRRLAGSNALLIALDRRGDAYRFHQLFAECLQERLRLVDPDAHRAAHRRACDWNLHHDRHEAAFNHALHAGDVDLAANVATASATALMSSGRTQTVRQQLGRLGETVIAEHPDLALVGALVSGVEGDERAPIDVPYYLDLALTDPDRSATDPRVLRETAEAISVLFSFAPVGEACALGDQIDAISVYRRGRLTALTTANYFAGRHDESRRYAQHALTGSRGAPDPRTSTMEIAICTAYLANIAVDDGQFDQAGALINDAMTMIDENDLMETPSATGVPIAAGRLQARLGAYAEAEELFQLGLRYAPSWSMMRIFARVELARMSIEQEEIPTALGHLEAAGIAIDAHPDPGVLVNQHQALIRMCRSAAVDFPAASRPDLSSRELELVGLLSTDMTNREIAEQLFISHNTVKSHLRLIYQKLGATSRDEAVAKAAEGRLQGETPPSPG